MPYIFMVWTSFTGLLCVILTQLIAIAAAYGAYWVKARFYKADNEKDLYFQRAFLPACFYQTFLFIAAFMIPAIVTQDNTGILSGILSIGIVVASPLFAIIACILLNHLYIKYTRQTPLRNSFSLWLGSFAWGILALCSIQMTVAFIMMLISA